MKGLIINYDFSFFRKKNGQSIIEVTFAVSLISLLIVALVSAVTVSIRNARYAKNKSLAVKYINEGIEAVRSIRDKNWSAFYNRAGTGDYTNLGLELSSGQWQFNGSLDTPAEGFKRVVSLKRLSEDIIEVRVTVSWSEKSEYDSETSATTKFSKWK